MKFKIFDNDIYAREDLIDHIYDYYSLNKILLIKKDDDKVIQNHILYIVW